jgi:hypothetical protein
MPDYYFKYHGIFSEFNKINAAICIQRYWREYRYNPRFRLCERVITRSLIELANNSGIKLEIKGDNEYIRFLRKKNFEHDLTITNRVLKKIKKNKMIHKKNTVIYPLKNT